VPIDFTREEAALVAEILDTSYRELKEQINKTEDTDFRRMLKQREALLLAALEKMRAGAAA
jgi:hypothetical protein